MSLFPRVSTFALLSATTLLTSLVTLAACGGTTETLVADAGTPDVSVIPEAGPMPDVTVVNPPTDAGSDVTMLPLGDGGVNLAFHKIFLGETDRSGASSPTAWKAYGMNLDGKTTTASSTDVCTLQQGAPKSTQDDGNNGVDNSWGENILPIFLSISGNNPSAALSMQMNAGAFTTMIYLPALGSDPAETASPVGAQLFVGSPLLAPSWTVADDWPVRPEYLVNANDLSAGSKIRFPSGAVAAGVWTSAPPADVPFDVAFGGSTLHLAIHQAILQFTHSAPTKGSLGTVAGVLDTQEVVAAFRLLAGHISSSLCSGSAFQSIVVQLEQASDILHDATNVAGQTCDAISIGLGFEADEIGPPQKIGPPAAPTADPCDAGGD